MCSYHHKFIFQRRVGSFEPAYDIVRGSHFLLHFEHGRNRHRQFVNHRRLLFFYLSLDHRYRIGYGNHNVVDDASFELQHRNAGSGGAFVVGEAQQLVVAVEFGTVYENYAGSAFVAGCEHFHTFADHSLKHTIPAFDGRSAAQHNRPFARHISRGIIVPSDAVVFNFKSIPHKNKSSRKCSIGGEWQRHKVFFHQIHIRANAQAVAASQGNIGDQIKILITLLPHQLQSGSRHLVANVGSRSSVARGAGLASCQIVGSKKVDVFLYFGSGDGGFLRADVKGEGE